MSGCGDPEHCPQGPGCDFCGDPIDGDVHTPHDDVCPNFRRPLTIDCECDHEVCEGCCWTCALEAAT